MSKRVLITTMVLQHPNSDIDYIAAGRRMVESYLKYTPHYILIVTNVPDEFKDIVEKYSGRFYVSFMPLECNEFNRFDYTLKLQAIGQASMQDVDVVYWIDADLYTIGWDEESFQEALDLPYDVLISGPMHTMSLDRWCERRKGSWTPLDGESFMHSHSEHRVIYKNMDLLRKIVKLWDNNSIWDKHLEIIDGLKLFELGRGTPIEHWRCREGSDGLLMGESIFKSQGSFLELTHNEYKFTDYEKVVRRPNLTEPQFKVLDRWWGAGKDRFMFSSRSVIGIDAYDKPKFDDKLRDIQKSIKNNK